MKLQLESKKALVFASSQGIGRGVAENLVEHGAHVIVSSRNEETLKEVAADIGAAGYVVSDLNERDAAKKLVLEASELLGGLDILVTNAGGPPAGAFEEISNEDWQKGFQSLFMAIVDGVNTVLPIMRKNQWGRIVAITSSSAVETIPNLTVSNAIRPAIHGLINSISREVASEGITINAVMPGYIETERIKELGFSIEKALEQVPVGRLGTPKDLGELVAFLCSEPGGFMTGQAIPYDGGKLMSI